MARTTYAIAHDLSGVIPTEDGFGRFATRLEALERLERILTEQALDVVTRLRATRKMLARERRKQGTQKS